MNGIIKDLETFIPLFAQAVDEKDRKNTLKDLSINLVEQWNNFNIPINDTIDSIFKKTSQWNLIDSTLGLIITTMSFNILQSNFLLSETFVKNTGAQMADIKRKIDLIIPPQIKQPIISPTDIIHVVKLYKKYPNTRDLFIITMGQVKDTDLAIVELEKLKHTCDIIPSELPSNIYLNLLQRYSFYANGPGVSLSEIIKNELNITNVKLENMSAISKSKNIAIILIQRSTNVVYNTWKLFTDEINSKSGINKQLINQTDTIQRCENSHNQSITIHIDGKAIDVLKLRKFNPRFNEWNINKFLILDSTSHNLWRKLSMDKMHVIHLLSGPNKILTWKNQKIEDGILEHWKGAKEIQFTSTHTPVAHIRQKIKSRIMEFWNKTKIVKIDDIDKFIQNSNLNTIYNKIQFEAYSEYSSKIKNKIVGLEASSSYLSDLGIRGRRFRRELNNLYNKNRSTIVIGSTRKDAIELENEIAQMMEISLAASISERDNIYNTIDEKRILFSS